MDRVLHTLQSTSIIGDHRVWIFILAVFNANVDQCMPAIGVASCSRTSTISIHTDRSCEIVFIKTGIQLLLLGIYLCTILFLLSYLLYGASALCYRFYSDHRNGGNSHKCILDFCLNDKHIR